MIWVGEIRTPSLPPVTGTTVPGPPTVSRVDNVHGCHCSDCTAITKLPKVGTNAAIRTSYIADPCCNQHRPSMPNLDLASSPEHRYEYHHHCQINPMASALAGLHQL